MPRKKSRARKPARKGRAKIGRSISKARRSRAAPPRGRKRAKAPQARPSRRSISKRIEETEKAIRTLGEKRIRRGSIVLGETSRVGPTKKGFASIKRVVKSVNKVNRVGKQRVFSYDIEGTFKGADGKLHRFKREGVGIPRLRDVKRKKGESQAAALSRTVETRIRREIMGILREKAGYKDFAKFKGRRISKAKAKAALQRFKRTRDVRFKIRFRREV